MSSPQIVSFVDTPKWYGEIQGRDMFPVAGWVASVQPIERVSVVVNGSVQDARLRPRPDVEAVHGARYGHISGYRTVVSPGEGNCAISIEYHYRGGILAKRDDLVLDHSAPGTERPDFLGIGAQKAGTTWLYENLRRHEGIYFPNKELHFFDRKSELDKGVEHYFRMFGPGAGRIKGEITPDYCSLPMDRLRFIGDVIPDARIILLMRHPIERSWSGQMMHCLHYAKRQFESMTRDEVLIPLISETSGVYMMSDYYTILKNWMAVYPKEHIHVEFHDNIRREPEGVFRRVLSHMGAEIPRDLRSFPLRRVFQPTFAGFFDETIAKPPIPDDIIPELKRVYFPMIERLRTLIQSEILDEWLRWPR